MRPSDLYQWLRCNIQYDYSSIESYRFRSPEQLVEDGMGKCYDIANYVASKLDNVTVLFIKIITKEKKDYFHAIPVYEYKNYYYFMELTNGAKLGIHGGYHKYEITYAIERLFWGPRIDRIEHYLFPKVEYGATEAEIIATLGSPISFDENIHDAEDFGTKIVVVLFYKNSPTPWKPLHRIFVKNKISVCICRDVNLLNDVYGPSNFIFIGDNLSMVKAAASIGAKCVTIETAFEDIVEKYTNGKEYIATADSCICCFEDISKKIPMYSELYEYRDYPAAKVTFAKGDDIVKIIKDGNKHYTISYFAEEARNLYRYKDVAELIYKIAMNEITLKATLIKQLEPFPTCVENNIMIFIDPEIPNPKWWIDKSYDLDIGYCIDGRDVICDQAYAICLAKNKDNFHGCDCFIISDKPIEVETWNALFIVNENVETIRSIYGRITSQLYEVNSTDYMYEWIVQRKFEVFMFPALTDISYNLYHMLINKFDIQDRWNLTDILNNYAKAHKKILTSDDFNTLGHGWFNLTYLIDGDVIRIHINDEGEFDEEGAKILMSEKNTGFVPVKEVGDNYTVVASCEPIDDEKNYNKLKKMLDLNRKFFIKHQNLCYCDYHYGNIMTYQDEYVIVDIDLNMLMDGDLKLDVKLDKFEGLSDLKLNYNVRLYNAILDYAAIEKTYLTMTLTAIELFEAAGYKARTDFSMKLIDDVVARLRKGLDGVKIEKHQSKSYRFKRGDYFKQ